MNNDVFNRIGDYYNDLVGTYGHDPKSCDYGHAVSQQIKFNVLSNCTDYTNKSVLDIGCGFADYYDFLSSKYKNVDYHGVDLSSSMISEAQKLHPGLSLEVKNVFETMPDRKYDIVTANGIFYLLGNNAQHLMKDFVTRMFEMSNEVVAFNTLSTWANDQQKNEFYADPAEVLNFCCGLTKWVNIRHDYHDRDFSVFLYKNKN